MLETSYLLQTSGWILGAGDHHGACKTHAGHLYQARSSKRFTTGIVQTCKCTAQPHGIK